MKIQVKMVNNSCYAEAVKKMQEQRGMDEGANLK